MRRKLRISTPEEDDPIIIDEETQEIITKEAANYLQEGQSLLSLDNKPDRIHETNELKGKEVSKHDMPPASIGSLAAKRKRNIPIIGTNRSESESLANSDVRRTRKRPKKKSIKLSFED